MDTSNLIKWFVEIAVIVACGLTLRRYVSRKRITVKQIAFVGVISAMGIALTSVLLIPIAPGVSIDLSHISTFIVAIALGPFYGMITGAIIGVYPMLHFANPLLPVGKALTGLVIGLLIMRARLVIGVESKERTRLLRIVPTTIIGWIPEAAFVLITLGYLGLPYFLPMEVIETILVKGTGEIILLGILCEFLFASRALKTRLEAIGEN